MNCFGKCGLGVKRQVRSSDTIDDKVVKSQQSILIPTAIRANARVLNRFLPRFKITAEVSQSEEMVGTLDYSIRGEVKQKISGSVWWNEKLIIKNGVYLIINEVATKISARINGKNFNEFSYGFSAQPGDKVWLRYDLGGYVIESNKVEIKAEEKCKSNFQFTYSFPLKIDNNYKLKESLGMVIVNGQASNVKELSIVDIKSATSNTLEFKMKKEQAQKPIILSGLITGKFPTPSKFINHLGTGFGCTYTFSNPTFEGENISPGNKFQWMAVDAKTISWDRYGSSTVFKLIYDVQGECKWTDGKKHEGQPSRWSTKNVVNVYSIGLRLHMEVL